MVYQVVLADYVHQHVCRIGGYWPPLSAVARLLEECGEFAEVALNSSHNRNLMLSELVDIVFTSTCIANQYKVPLRACQDKGEVSINTEASLLARIIQLSGVIARVVNYYDGPKAPKTEEQLPRLRDIIPALHGVIDAVFKPFGLSLMDGVKQAIDRSAARDCHRFKAQSFDPITSETLVRMRCLLEKPYCPYTSKSRLWGGDWNEARDLDWNVAQFVPQLTRFSKCAQPEQIEAMVLGIPLQSIDTIEDFKRIFCYILKYLAAHSPDHDNCFRREINHPDWQFSFNGVRFFITTFAPYYDSAHPSFSWCADTAFIMFQPEFSFEQHQILAANPQPNTIKQGGCESFSLPASSYDVALASQPIEAIKYIKPLNESAAAIRWWE